MGKQLWRRLGPLGISCVGKAAVQSKASLEYTTMCLGIPGQIVEITDGCDQIIPVAHFVNIVDLSQGTGDADDPHLEGLAAFGQSLSNHADT